MQAFCIKLKISKAFKKPNACNLRRKLNIKTKNQANRMLNERAGKTKENAIRFIIRNWWVGWGCNLE